MNVVNYTARIVYASVITLITWLLLAILVIPYLPWITNTLYPKHVIDFYGGWKKYILCMLDHLDIHLTNSIANHNALNKWFQA